MQNGLNHKSPGLLRQVGHYFGGQIAVMAAGLISMPILTRAFTEEEYGIVNLLGATVLLLVAASKIGLSQASVRFAGRPREGEEQNERELQSTILMASLVSATFFALAVVAGACVLLWLGSHPREGHGLLASEGIQRFLFGNRSTAYLMVLAGVLIIPRTLTSIMLSLMRSERRSKLYTVFSVLMRYGSLMFGIGGFFIAKSMMPEMGLIGYFGGVLLVEGGLTLAFLWAWWREHGLGLSLTRSAVLRMSLAYGLPLVIYEISSILVGYCDKYIIQFYRGLEDVARYSAGYGVAEMLPVLFTFPVELAIVPHAVRLWEESGASETGEFLSSAAARYVVAVFPVLALFCVGARPIVTFIASEKYADSAMVVPWVIAGLALWQGFCPIVSMGFMVRKRTRALTAILCLAVVFNVALNIVMVRMYGYLGAAVTTLVTYASVLLLAGLGSSRYLRVPWRYGAMLRATLMSIGVSAAVWLLPIGNGLLPAAVKILIGAFLYTRIMARIDDSAQWGLGVAARWLRKHNLDTRWFVLLTGCRPAESEAVG